LILRGRILDFPYSDDLFTLTVTEGPIDCNLNNITGPTSMPDFSYTIGDAAELIIPA